MTQDNLIARLTRPIVGIENRTAQEVFDIMVDRFKDPPAPIERLSPPLDGEGVIQADRDAAAAIVEWQNGLEPRFFHPDMPAGIREGVWDNHNVVQAFAAHRRAATISTPREDEVDLTKVFWESLEKAAAESTWIPPEYFVNDWVSDCADFLRNGPALATLTPREQIRAEAWQPIETAPKDGRYIIAGKFKDGALGWVKHSRWITADEIAEIEHGEPDEFDAGWTDGNRDDEPCYPSHWRPLPEPPALASADAVLGEGE